MRIRLIPPSWLHLPHRTARLRLALLYAGMFLLTCAAVLVLVNAAAAGGGTIAVAHRSVSARPGPSAFTVTPRGVAAALPHPKPPSKLVIAQRSADLHLLFAVSLIALAFATLASALFGWIAAGRVLRPVRTITAAARTISAGNLHERLALAGPTDDEFKQLGDTLDDLLGRLESSFEAQRRFVANASHELRTPLTLERTLLQVALSDPEATAQTLRATCEELLAAGQEQEQLLEGLLTLASSERGLERRERFDLSEIAERVLASTRARAERLGVQVDSELASAPVFGDRSLIERLVANLSDNAVRYNHPGGRVAVRTATGAGASLLSVTNTGPSVAAEEVERLFEPFQRLAADRTTPGEDGHGLGLSIARAIATAHDATITAEPRPEGGLVVTVSFPPATSSGT